MLKLLLPLLFLAYTLPLFGQEESYLKAIQTKDNSNRIFCVPSKDKGWFLFSGDSIKVYKFNHCGLLEWEKKYSSSQPEVHGADFIPTLNGGFAFLLRNYPAPLYYGIIVNADANGNVLWSKAIVDSPYVEVAYNILQDNSGNFFLYGNVTFAPTNEVYNSFTKINSAGNVLWRKLYDHGGIWGGAILTKDNGFLFRTGSTFFKTDAAGSVAWTSTFTIGLYQYHKAIEVADGYIFNGYANNAQGGDTISFFKMDKNGSMLWGGKKQVNYTGAPLQMASKYNGNLMFLHGKAYAGKFYSGWTEFDKDLNVVNQSSVESITNKANFTARNICFLSDSSALIAGVLTVNDTGVFIPQLACLKTDKNQHFTCDTSFTLSSKVLPALQNFTTTQAGDRNFNSRNQIFTVTTSQNTLQTYCARYTKLSLDLGNDTILCEASNLILKNKTGNYYDRYLWSNGSTASQIQVSQPGKYWVRAINFCQNDSLSDTLEIKFSAFPKPDLVSDTSFCAEKPLVLDASITGGTYLWQDGSTSAQYPVTEPGNYKVTISYLNCTKDFEISIGDCEILRMPNVISPNNDALNNRFLPIEMRGILEARLTIFNRWGQELYYSSDMVNRPWLGYSYNKKCSDGIYYWMVEYTNYRHQLKVQKGSVSLFLD
jgi:gliding motility-associated-like protein